MTLFVAANPAWAGSNRAWVSGHGVDQAGCGAPTAPCRSLQYAHDHIVDAGGEIDILDPAGYGRILITKAISIINDGVGVAGVHATSGVIVNVSAGPGDDVRLRGLNIEGLHSALEGIGFASGASLTIEDSSINGVTNAGVQFEPIAASTLYVVNTKVTNCGTRGV